MTFLQKIMGKLLYGVAEVCFEIKSQKPLIVYSLIDLRMFSFYPFLGPTLMPSLFSNPLHTSVIPTLQGVKLCFFFSFLSVRFLF